MWGRQSRKVIWDMINTLFLTLQLSNLLLLLSFRTRKHKSMASRAINVQISLKYSELKTTHNTFRDCRVAVYRRFRESATQAIIFQSSDLFHFDNVLKAEHLRCVKISSGSREGARPPSPPPLFLDQSDPPPPRLISGSGRTGGPPIWRSGSATKKFSMIVSERFNRVNEGNYEVLIGTMSRNLFKVKRWKLLATWVKHKN